MLTVCGAGPGHPDYLTKQVEKAIVSADEVLAFGRIAEGLSAIRADIQVVRTVKELKDRNFEGAVVLLASGDPLFYGVVDYLLRHHIPISEVMPGLSSFQYLVAKCQTSWENAVLLSCHGRELEIGDFVPGRAHVVLTDGINTPYALSERLHTWGYSGKMTVGYRLSYEDEQIVVGSIGQIERGQSPLAVVVIEL